MLGFQFCGLLTLQNTRKKDSTYRRIAEARRNSLDIEPLLGRPPRLCSPMAIKLLDEHMWDVITHALSEVDFRP
jgi:hypothetical protein